jgi:3-hydroxybutyryl-CoA dehydrogenase
MHFFNPVPMMKLVEVIPGVATDRALTDAMVDLVLAWGKTPVRARSTPGFIVNRVARPFYGESLLLAEQQTAPIDVIDRLLRGSAGFRMGPFQLMDLVGNDVNSTVTRTVWEGHHFDPRFTPSILQTELVAAGRYGRKSGQGFYTYDDDEVARPAPSASIDATALGGPETPDLALSRLLARLGLNDVRPIENGAAQTAQGTIVLTRGRTAVEEAAVFGTPVVVVDRPLEVDATLSLAFSATSDASALVDMLRPAACRRGLDLIEVGDVPGLLTARVAAMLINDASEVVSLGLCSAEDVDLAMTLGTNYPIGLLAWCHRWTARYVETLVDTLADQYRSPRYRTSLAIRLAALNDKGTR